MSRAESVFLRRDEPPCRRHTVVAKRSAKSESARGLAIEAARIAQHDNAEEIVVLNLKAMSQVTDYFVICTGTSNRQMRTVAEDVIRYARSIGQSVFRVAGIDGGDWIVLDFVDVVVHIFDESHRRYYDLELIWGEAPHVRWRGPAQAVKAKTASSDEN